MWFTMRWIATSSAVRTCSSEAEQATITATSTNSKTGSTDTLVCRKSGAVVRTIGDAQMTATNIALAFLVSLLLLILLVACLKGFAAIRRRSMRG